MIRLDGAEDGLAIVTLNRAEKANALNRAMLEQLLATIAELAARPPRALVLTGAGQTFSAGADLDEARSGLARAPLWEQLSAAIAALPSLTVAALNGTVAGGAMGMILACDLRIAVPQARFFYPVMRLGFMPQPSDPARLTALVGPARAKMMLMAGWKAQADEALAWGLVDRIVPRDMLGTEARAICADAMGAADDHLRAIKGLWA